MKWVERMKARWGVGLWGMIAIFTAFALAGSSVVRLKKPILGFIMPDDAPTWLQVVVYILIVFPLYQVLLLAYGTLLGQFNFFWGKLKMMGRAMTGRRLRDKRAAREAAAVAAASDAQPPAHEHARDAAGSARG